MNRSTDRTPPDGETGHFVWQRHEPFVDIGRRIADRAGVPWVLSLHAIHADEARSWGVDRPGWSRAFRRWGELVQIGRADLVTVVSPRLEEAVRNAVTSPPPIACIGAGIDKFRFHPDPQDRATIRESLGIPADQVVIGWHGSFRSFHGLDILLRAVADRSELGGVRLLLIGHGLQRVRLERLAHELSIEQQITWTGEVDHQAIPSLLRALDIAVVLATDPSSFHYSPLKLREYQASGIPVVASRAGILQDLGEKGEVAVSEPGDSQDLGQALVDLMADSERRRTMVAAGLKAAEAVTWDKRLDELIAALATLS